MIGPKLALNLYRLLTVILLPIIIIWMIIRIVKGKEFFPRIKERFGYASIKRRSGKYIWLHGTSIGESLIALNLSNHLKNLYPEYKFLITTSTVTSAKIISSKISDGIIHQFIPIDEYFAVKRFFRFWKPSFGIFIESEIWPNLISISSSYCPIILANAIMSDKSFKKWMKVKNISSYLLDMFSIIICQSKNDYQKYSQLCSTNIEYTANLKFSAPKPYVDPKKFMNLRKMIGDRHVLLAASTHDGEEEIICNAAKELAIDFPNLLTIIAPRHPIRVDDISTMISSYNLTFATRSKKQDITPEIAIYLADSLGELGLFFSIASVSFVGGSFRFGGHNILEPAYFDTKIIVGPDMKNSLEITNEFLSANAMMQAKNPEDLTDKIRTCLQEENSKTMIENAKKILLGKEAVIDYYIKKIINYLPEVK